MIRRGAHHTFDNAHATDPYREREIAGGSTVWFADDGSIESIDEPTEDTDDEE